MSVTFMCGVVDGDISVFRVHMCACVRVHPRGFTHVMVRVFNIRTIYRNIVIYMYNYLRVGLFNHVVFMCEIIIIRIHLSVYIYIYIYIYICICIYIYIYITYLNTTLVTMKWGHSVSTYLDHYSVH